MLTPSDIPYNSNFFLNCEVDTSVFHNLRILWVNEHSISILRYHPSIDILIL